MIQPTALVSPLPATLFPTQPQAGEGTAFDLSLAALLVAVPTAGQTVAAPGKPLPPAVPVAEAGVAIEPGTPLPIAAPAAPAGRSPAVHETGLALDAPLTATLLAAARAGQAPQAGALPAEPAVPPSRVPRAATPGETAPAPVSPPADMDVAERPDVPPLPTHADEPLDPQSIAAAAVPVSPPQPIAGPIQAPPSPDAPVAADTMEIPAATPGRNAPSRARAMPDTSLAADTKPAASPKAAITPHRDARAPEPEAARQPPDLTASRDAPALSPQAEPPAAPTGAALPEQTPPRAQPGVAVPAIGHPPAAPGQTAAVGQPRIDPLPAPQTAAATAPVAAASPALPPLPAAADTPTGMPAARASSAAPEVTVAAQAASDTVPNAIRAAPVRPDAAPARASPERAAVPAAAVPAAPAAANRAIPTSQAAQRVPVTTPEIDAIPASAGVEVAPALTPKPSRELSVDVPLPAHPTRLGAPQRSAPAEAAVAPGPAAAVMGDPAPAPATPPTGDMPVPGARVAPHAAALVSRPADVPRSQPVVDTAPAPAAPAFVPADTRPPAPATAVAVAPAAPDRPGSLSPLPNAASGAAPPTPILAAIAPPSRPAPALAATRVSPATPQPAPLPGSDPTPLIAGAAAPAFRLFAAAIHAARTEERDRALPLSATPPAAPVEQPGTAIAPVSQGAALDMTDRRWPHAMAAHIERLQEAAGAAKDAASTTIRLVPDALGTVDVALRTEGDTVHVHFSADQPATRTLIAEAQPRLTELAEARGIKLAPTTIGASVSGGSDGGQRQPPPAPQTSRAPAPAAQRDEDPEPTTTRVA